LALLLEEKKTKQINFLITYVTVLLGTGEAIYTVNGLCQFMLGEVTASFHGPGRLRQWLQVWLFALFVLCLVVAWLVGSFCYYYCFFLGMQVRCVVDEEEG